MLDHTKSFSKVYATPVSRSRFQGLLVCLSMYIVPEDILIPWDTLSICDFYERDMSIPVEYLYYCWKGFHITKAGLLLAWKLVLII